MEAGQLRTGLRPGREDRTDGDETTQHEPATFHRHDGGRRPVGSQYCTRTGPSFVHARATVMASQLLLRLEQSPWLRLLPESLQKRLPSSSCNVSCGPIFRK